MGNTLPTSLPQESEDNDTTFLGAPGAALTLRDWPWGKEGITLDDVAHHAAIAHSVIRRAALYHYTASFTRSYTEKSIFSILTVKHTV